MSVELTRFDKFILEWITKWRAEMRGVKRFIVTYQTKYQLVDIVEFYDFGKALLLDGKTQSTLYDEHIYHESLVHPVMITHPNPKKVYILGGGEGATAREVLKYDVEKVVMVDIDKELIEFVKKYMPEWHQGSFDDPRLELHFTDGRKFLEETNETFDVAIIDATDPLEGGPSVLLYTKEFYEIVYKRLSDDGIMVTQATSPYSSPETFATIYKTIASVFPIARAYVVYVPSFITPWGFVVGSKKYDPAKLTPEEVDKRLSERKIKKLRYYRGKAHLRMFLLPPEVEELLARKDIPIATDKNPTYMPA